MYDGLDVATIQKFITHTKNCIQQHSLCTSPFYIIQSVKVIMLFKFLSNMCEQALSILVEEREKFTMKFILAGLHLLITFPSRQEESYRCGVSECDRETSQRRPKATRADKP
jgi:hypothetical protein